MNQSPNPALMDDTGKLVLRLVLGILILFHGVAKIRYGIGPVEGMLMSKGVPAFLAWPVYLGEVVGPLMVIAGYFARIGAALIVANMIVAILVAHTGDLLSFTQFGGWQLELQGMYLFTALALALLGPGRFSINRR